MAPGRGQQPRFETNIPGQFPQYQMGYQQGPAFNQYQHLATSLGQTSGFSQHQQYSQAQQNNMQQYQLQQQHLMEQKRKAEEEERRRQQEAAKQRDFEQQRMKLQAMGLRDKASGKAKLDDMFGKAITGLTTSSLTSKPKHPVPKANTDAVEFSDFMQAPLVGGHQTVSVASQSNPPIPEPQQTATPQLLTHPSSLAKPNIYENLVQESLSNMRESSSQGRTKFTPPVVPKFEAKPYTQTYAQSDKSRSWTSASEDFSGLFKVELPQQQPGDFQKMAATHPQPVLSVSQRMPHHTGSQAQQIVNPQSDGAKGTPPAQRAARIPAWCLPNSPLIPDLYKQVFTKCKDTQGIHVDTNLVFPVLMASGLSRTTLKAIWATANKMNPGKLNRIELYIALGLIGLAQTGCTDLTVAALAGFSKPIVPQLHGVDLAELPAKEQESSSTPPKSPVPQDLIGGFDRTSSEVVNVSAGMDTQVPVTSQASQQQSTVTPFPNVAADPNDRYSVFRSFSDPKPNEVTVQSQVPPVATDQFPVDPSDKYSIFRTFEGTTQTLSNQPIQSHLPVPDLLVSAAPIVGSNVVTDSQTVVASLVSGSPLADVSDMPQQQLDHDFGAFSDFQSAPAPSIPLTQFQSSVQERGFADFQSSMFTSSLPKVPPQQSQATSDTGFTAFHSTVPVVLPEVQSQGQSSGDSGFLAFQSAAPVITEQPQVPSDSGFTNFQAAMPVIHPEMPSQGQIKINTGGQPSDVTASVSVHEEQPVLSKVHSGGDLASFQQPSAVTPSSIASLANVCGDNFEVATGKSSGQSNCKTLLALSMDESSSPAVVVSSDAPVDNELTNELNPGTGMVGEDSSLIDSRSQPVGRSSTEDDSFGDFSGVHMPPAKPELQVLSTSSANFSSSSSSSSLSKMNIMSSNWSDLASLADLGVSSKPNKREFDELSAGQTANDDLGQKERRVTFQTGGDFTTNSNDVPSDQPGNQTNSYLSEVVKLNWTSNEQSVFHPKPILFGSRYERLDSQEAETNVHEGAWSQCLKCCFEDLQKACDILKQITSQQILTEVLNSSQGQAYFSAVVEVYRVSRRIQATAPNLQVLQVHFEDLKLKWNVLASFLSDTDLQPSETSLDFTDLVLPTSEMSTDSACGVCLLDVSRPGRARLDGQANPNRPSNCNRAILQYGGRRYCAPCANYWCNKVDSVLPALPLYNPLL